MAKKYTKKPKKWVAEAVGRIVKKLLISRGFLREIIVKKLDKAALA